MTKRKSLAKDVKKIAELERELELFRNDNIARTRELAHMGTSLSVTVDMLLIGAELLETRGAHDSARIFRSQARSIHPQDGCAMGVAQDRTASAEPDRL